jgi:hypothetical protein
MNILYIGDIMAEPGMRVVEKVLPGLKRQHSIDLVIAQAENVTDGKGLSRDDFNRLKRLGIDFCTGGNHSFTREDIFPQLSDPAQPVIRPANYPAGTPGLGYKHIETPKGRVLVISLLGRIVGKDAELPMDNPLQVVDQILRAEQAKPNAAIVVNFHGDYSSEKRIVGHYLDGRVTMVVGDHWHIQTNDADVLPGGTAHITDVGMCGSLDSSLGIRYKGLVERWRDGYQNRNEVETGGRMQFNALLVGTDDRGRALSATAIRQVF